MNPPATTPLRICFVNRYFAPDHSATSRLLSDLAFGLAGAGHHVQVITSRQLYEHPFAQLPADEVNNGVRVHRVWTTRWGRSGLVGRAIDYLSFYVTAGLALRRVLSHGDLLIAKTDPPLIGVLAASVARWRGAKSIHWLQDVFPEVAERLGLKILSGRMGRLLQRWRDRSLRDAAGVVVLGDRMARHMEAGGLDRQRIHVIPNWSDIKPDPLHDDTTSPLRREWGLEGRFVIMYSGNMGRAHEFETMIEAAEVLRHEENIVFLWVGGGAKRAEVAHEVESRGLRNCLFQPYQPDERLRDSLSVGDVHLVSLRPNLEGLIVPSKLYGIFSVGRPVIFIGALDGEVSHIITRENAGAAVEEGNVESLVGVIRQYVADEALRKQQGLRALQLASGVYARQTALQRWTDVIEEAGKS